MIQNHDIIKLRAIHDPCQCEIETLSVGEDSRSRLDKDGGSVFVEHLAIALDCDICGAFTERDTRPDIIAIQECGMSLSWLIIEIKNRMRPRAADQVKTALERLCQDSLFPVQLKEARIVFVIGNRRRADNTLMRDIGTIEVGQWRIVPRLLRSGDTVKCRSVVSEDGSTDGIM